MAEFDLEDLGKIRNNDKLLDELENSDIVKKKKFIDLYDYEKALFDLQVKLLQLQYQIIEEKKRVLVILEGRDAAGKGGTIGRLTENLNGKKTRVVALPTPTDIEQGQWYFQRYIKQLPNPGEIVFFDRSWYNRAAVEPVFGFCTKKQYKLFMKQVPDLEKDLIDDGIVLIKIFLDISKKEQAARLAERKNDILKKWKIGPLDQKAQEKWNDYSGYFEKMFKKTGSKSSPWHIITTDNKRDARIAAFKVIINQLSKEEIENPEIVKTIQ